MKIKFLYPLILILLFPFCSVLAQNLANKVYNLNKWKFAKNAPEMWTDVTVPHSCNAIDGRSASYFRGKSYYKKTIDVTPEMMNSNLYLLFEGAAQAAKVSINGKQVAYHKGGYTPFVISLNNNIKTGNNEVIVQCDNSLDVSLIPVHSDFNKNNGLHNPVYLLDMGKIYFSPLHYGLYRMHVSTPVVDRKKAETTVETLIQNSSSQKKNLTVKLSLKNRDGNICYKENRKVVVLPSDSLLFKRNFTIKNPHLWDGVDDPYLYDLSIVISDSDGKVLDNISTKVGYRFYSMDKDKGFFLNGRLYPLRGVAMHQDWDNKASALTKEDFDTDYEFVKEIGCNFLRLAHYPHNDYAFRKCDELGIIVQTEIPWVNVCGVKADNSYFENIHQQMKEMISNLYNHPSIVMWGMWNEIDSWGNDNRFQGSLDADRAVKETALLYDYAKKLDSYRSVGMTDDSNYMRPGYNTLKGDFYSENRYNGWYYGKMEEFERDMKSNHEKMGVVNVSEYGVGINPFCHSLNPLKTTKLGMGGNRHDEEFGNLFHESYWRQIIKMPFLNFTSVWVFFDFPVADRQEGYMDTSDGETFTESEFRKFTNDKGLVSRDRKVKKDVFYFYKSLWNEKVPTVYITSRRFTKRPADEPLSIKVYSNAKKLTLYQNGKEVETMTGSGEDTGVVWNFKPISFQSDSDTFKVIGDNGVEDSVVFSR